MVQEESFTPYGLYASGIFVGAALGNSFGVSGVVGGLIFGAIAADVVWERLVQP